MIDHGRLRDLLLSGATYTEAGQLFGVTRERIRQLAAKVCSEVAGHRCATPGCATRPRRFTSPLCYACAAAAPPKPRSALFCACGKRAVYSGTCECQACYKRRRYRDNSRVRASQLARSARWRERRATYG